MFLTTTEVCRSFWRYLMCVVGASDDRFAVGPGVDIGVPYDLAMV